MAISKGAVVVPPPWFLTRPSTSRVCPSRRLAGRDQRRVHQIGQCTRCAASSCRRSKDSSSQDDRPAPPGASATSSPAVMGRHEIHLLLEIAAGAMDGGGPYPGAGTRQRTPTVRSSVGCALRVFRINPSMGFYGPYPPLGNRSRAAIDRLTERYDNSSYWRAFMATTKVAVSLDSELLERLDRLVADRIFASRSQAVQDAIRDKLDRLARTRLARECAKLELRRTRAGRRAGCDRMAGILRGEIVWANLDPTLGRDQSGHRPILVISHDVFNERSGTVIAMAITSQPQLAGYPLSVELLSGNLPKRSWVKISQVLTLSTQRIGARIGRVAPEELEHLVEGLNEIVGS